MRRALFLDRDGIVNLDHGYVHRREKFDFVDGIFDLAAEATRRGLPLVVATNQSGIGRGRYTEADFQALMAWVAAGFAARGTPLARIEHCPDHPDAAGPRRKPAPGMLLDAAVALGLDPARQHHGRRPAGRCRGGAARRHRHPHPGQRGAGGSGRCRDAASALGAGRGALARGAAVTSPFGGGTSQGVQGGTRRGSRARAPCAPSRLSHGE
ncbi:D-glycero-alpha-D-manno-heptose-1,7-bisphosphate 7-phosphatase [Dankookia sp. P2]|uniref:D-glycero-alpha-D-manno-heptose-1,7-bisphosphate 7-phosphatase n=1 Tax=Dankookia sp. P2 TaxID=3423955 RepID=UPI003D663E4D